MTSFVRVSKTYTAQYSDPIEFQKGDLIELTGRTDNWNGHKWLWAIAAKDGREGWIPDSFADVTKGAGQRASADYSARELTCIEGELLTVLHATHGWVWCKNESGDFGWVPAENLETPIRD